MKTQDIESQLREFPLQILKAEKIVRDAGVSDKISKKIDKILICGMGGSAIEGDLINSVVKKIPVFVDRTFDIPEYVDKNTLVFILSYSGDTREAISCYKKAKRRCSNIVIITSGGELGKLKASRRKDSKGARKEDKVVLIPKGLIPRMSLGYSFFIIFSILKKLKLIQGNPKQVFKVLKGFKPEVAKELAQRLKNKIPVIYAPSSYKGVAYRWQTQFNENAKTFAHSHVFPELAHNEIEITKMVKDIFFIIIEDSHVERHIRKEIKEVKKLIKKKGIKNVCSIKTKGKSFLSRMFYAIYFGDYLSYYLALINRVDPESYDYIKEVKKHL